MKPNNVFQDQSKVQTVLHCLTHTKNLIIAIMTRVFKHGFFYTMI